MHLLQWHTHTPKHKQFDCRQRLAISNVSLCRFDASLFGCWVVELVGLACAFVFYMSVVLLWQASDMNQKWILYARAAQTQIKLVTVATTLKSHYLCYWVRLWHLVASFLSLFQKCFSFHCFSLLSSNAVQIELKHCSFEFLNITLKKCWLLEQTVKASSFLCIISRRKSFKIISKLVFLRFSSHLSLKSWLYSGNCSLFENVFFRTFSSW